MAILRSVATNARLPNLAATNRVIIGGAEVFVIAGTLNFERSVGRRSQASFTVYTDPPRHFEQYQQVQIYDTSNTLVFSGYITNPKEAKVGFAGPLLHSITCIDQHWLAEKRRVVATYTNKTVGYIAFDLLNTILAQEGVTVGMIFDGTFPSPTLYPSPMLYPGGNVGLIPSATFNYCTVAEALDALVKAASASGIPYFWSIDQYKRLYVVPYTTMVYPTVVDGSNILQTDGSPNLTRANPTYRNTQYVAGGTAETLTQTETRKGDGNTQAWAMGFALAHVPTITVNGVAKTVGIKGVDSGKDFYWSKGDAVITQDNGATKLVGSDTLQVLYIGQYDSIVVNANPAQISYQASLDGTSGIVEHIETDASLSSVSDAVTRSSTLLDRYGVQAAQFPFRTRANAFAPGQLLTVNLPDFGLYNTQMLVESVSASDAQDRLNIVYEVKAISGPYDQDWTYFFAKALAKPLPADAINVGVSQSVTVLAAFQATETPTATLNVSPYACPLPGPTTYPGPGLYPC